MPFRMRSRTRSRTRVRTLLALVAGALALATVPAGAQSRPAIVVSPDLNAPWVLQFERPRVQQRQTRQPLARAREAVRAVPRVTRRAASIAMPRVDRAPAPAPAPKSRDGLDARWLPQTVAYSGGEKPGTIVISTGERHLYLVQPGGKARRYGVGVGKQGFTWVGSKKITRKAKWPGWTPPRQMIARERAKGRILPAHMPGGPQNPLGARALYLGTSLYRIHGTNQPWTIGRAVSSGCIRMRNQDVTDLYERVSVGARVIVR